MVIIAREGTWSVICVTCVVLALVHVLFRGVEVYMDEIFHVPQAQAYCKGDFHRWDEKITTLPGMYYWSYLVTLFGHLECTVESLRLTNVLLAATVPFFCSRIRTKLFPGDSNEARVAVAWIVFLYPVAFFFYFLYYSDTASFVFVLALYDTFLPVLTSKEKEKDPSTQQRRRGGMDILTWLLLFCLSSGAILARQTNVVWVVFIGASGALSCYERRHDVVSMGKGDMNVGGFAYFLLENVVELSVALSPLVVPCLAFVGFVVHNGGIVVGDKENHVVTAHWAMLFHPLALTVIAYGPLAVVQTWRLQPSWPKVVTYLLCFVIYLALTRGVIPHPFLLADNRHYAFYVFKYILSRSSLRVGLVPIYTLSAIFVMGSLQRARRTGLWMLLFVLCAGIALVPLPLLEPRYFTIAVALLLLHMPAPSRFAAGAAIVTSLVANALFIYIFVYRPFQWPDGSIARFMF